MEYTKIKIEADIIKLAKLLDSKMNKWVGRYQTAGNFQDFFDKSIKELNVDFREVAKRAKDQIEIRILQLQLDRIDKKIERIRQADDETEHSS